MKVFWDRAGRITNVGREQRFIYVEWEDPRDPYARLLIDITWYIDDFVENVVLPNLEMYLRRTPPLHVRRLGGTGECEFLIIDERARPFVITTRPPYDIVDYTQYWMRVRRARLGSRYHNFFLNVPEVAAMADAVEINVGNAALLLVPRQVFEKWLAMKAKFESLMQQLELELEERELASRLASSELHVEFE